MWKWMLPGTAALWCGCPKAETGSGVPLVQDDLAGLISQADSLWEQRGDETKLQQALELYAQADARSPTDRHVLEQLTRGWYFWGDGFTTDKALQIERWGKAVDYGNRCLGLGEAYATALANGQKEKDAASLTTKEDTSCLYWTATALGKWGRAQGIARTLRHLPTVKAYMSKVEELDPTYFHHGPARYWGAYYAALPVFAGQDLDKSAQYFTTSIESAPHYLATRVLRAEMLAVGRGDVKMFDSDLQLVLSSDPAARPEVAPENQREIEKAKALQARRAELFDSNALAAAGEGPVPSTPDLLAPSLPGMPTPGTPAPGTPAPETPATPVPAPGTPAAPAPAPGTPAPTEPAPAAPAPATPAPSQPAPVTPAPAPAPSQPAPATPAPAPAPAKPVPAPAPAPAPAPQP